jgi:hypothetical protein
MLSQTKPTELIQMIILKSRVQANKESDERCIKHENKAIDYAKYLAMKLSGM